MTKYLDDAPTEDLHLNLKERSQRNRRLLKGRLPGIGYLPPRGKPQPDAAPPEKEPDP